VFLFANLLVWGHSAPADPWEPGPLREKLRKVAKLSLVEPDPIQWTPRSTMSVIHGRPVRSLATNREPAVGG
jgi:hypothetical protein